MKRFRALKSILSQWDFAVLAILIGICIFYYAHAVMAHSAQYTITPGMPHDEMLSLFRSDIKEFGGKKAYIRFSAAMQPVPEAMQHEYAHEFGNELYKIEGENGMSACDTRFHFGCFHQFLSAGIAEHGVAAIDRLYHKCGAIAGGLEICLHGLGHGILATVGYSVDDLARALELCKPMQGDIPLVRCDGGVFMEYNIHTIRNVEGSPGIRLVENGDYFHPCNSVKAEFRNACTYWLPQWWYALMPGTVRDPAAPIRNAPYQEMAKRCASAEYPRTCYEGIGYIMISASNFNPEKARAICDSLGTKHNVSLYCRSMAARIFKGAETVHGGSAALCEGLPTAQHTFCTSYLKDSDDFLPEVLPEMRG